MLGPKKGNAAEDNLEKRGGEQLAKKDERWGGIPGATWADHELKTEPGWRADVVSSCAQWHKQEE